MYATGTTVVLNNIQMAGNTDGSNALDGGGGIRTVSTDLTLKGRSQIYDNEASGFGGGVYATGGKITYDDVRIGDNKAPAGKGDGVYLSGTAKVVTTKGVALVMGDTEVVGP